MVLGRFNQEQKHKRMKFEVSAAFDQHINEQLSTITQLF